MKSHKKGQALLETIFILPALIMIIILSFQIFNAIYKAHVTQIKVRQALLTQINHRANGGRDLTNKEVKFRSSTSIQTLGVPTLSQQQTPDLDIRIGICREVQCD